MAFILPLILIGIVLICIAMTIGEGLWSNLVTWLNVIFSGLLAMTLFEPLARQLNKITPSFVYFWEFLAIWIVFIVSLIVFRVATAFASRVRVRFLPPIETAGGIFFAFMIGWTMMSFSLTTLHTAPLAVKFLAGAFMFEPGQRNLFGIGPDRMWMGLVGMTSKGSLATMPPQPLPDTDRFFLRQAARRELFELEPGSTKKK